MSSLDRHSLAALEHGTPFTDRHIGPDAAQLGRMLETIGVGSLDELADRAMPTSIRSDPADWDLDRAPGSVDAAPPPAATEMQVLDELRALAASNTVLTPMLGLGYHGTLTPPVIRRNVLEDPAWYTAYTPYQPEISQGRLEALLNFQTVVCDLTGLDVAGASMLDESTAAAEAMLLLRRVDKSKSDTFLVDADTLPQTIAVLRTRAESLNIDIELVDATAELPTGDFFGLLLAAPGASGALRDHSGHHRRRARARRPGRRGLRPARGHDGHPARGAGRRRRRRVHPALRGAARLRRPARRVPRGAPAARAPAARPPRRDLDRRRRQPRPPARPADPRAAHPP